MNPEVKDEELIAKIGQGNEDALVTLMERHKQAIFQFVYRYLQNLADAAEVTEETFFKVYQNADRFKLNTAAPRTWIFTIALNLSRDRIRREKKRKGQISLQDSTQTSETGWSLEDKLHSGAQAPFQAVMSAEAVQRIQRQIALLPEKLKFPFIFCILEEHSYDACAAILHTRRKVIETRIYRARQLLKRQFDNDFEKSLRV